MLNIYFTLLQLINYLFFFTSEQTEFAQSKLDL
uniref:Uncharacterized protein n=1 Tax=Anguilla anguilla TaxID=7936 RepID=A0A0E9XVL1_ANGAN